MHNTAWTQTKCTVLLWCLFSFYRIRVWQNRYQWCSWDGRSFTANSLWNSQQCKHSGRWHSNSIPETHLHYQVEVNQDEVVDINLGCGLSDSHHRHRVFVGTYLGYGSNVAMSRYREELVQQYNTSRGKTLIRDHCLHQNLEENFTTKDGTQVTLSGKGDYRRCRDSVRAMLKANTSSLSDCSGTRCPVAPFVKPQVPFQYLPFLGTSEFWYTMQDVLHIGGDYNQRKFDRAATVSNLLE